MRVLEQVATASALPADETIELKGKQKEELCQDADVESEVYTVEFIYQAWKGTPQRFVVSELAGPTPDESIGEMAARLSKSCRPLDKLPERMLASVVLPRQKEMLQYDRYSFDAPCQALMAGSSAKEITLLFVDDETEEQSKKYRAEVAKNLGSLDF